MSTERSTPPDASSISIPLVLEAAGFDPLPRPATSFVGREREVDVISALISAPDVRLVTLTGPGGTGKTRLAIAAARRLEPAFPDGVVFVPFEATSEVAQVPARIAQSAGVPDSPGRPLADCMRDAFRHRATLLVLDNVEHLPGIETHVAELVTASEGLKVLCTSRGALGIAAEQVYPVPPLDPAEAVMLFEQRAQAVEPSFRTDDTDVIARICEQLEYLPLAIELAAARTNVLPLPALLERLKHQLIVLTGGPRDAPVRQRAMRDTITWSHDLLDPGDQRLLRRLAVFSGGFSLDAARVIANDGEDALEGVSRLVAAGIVRRMPGPAGDARFRLPVVIREFGEEELVAHGDGDAAHNRHASYYRDLAEIVIPNFDGPENSAYRDRIVAERDNCRAAMTWAMTTGDWETAIRIGGSLWRTWFPVHAIGGKAWAKSVEEGLDWIERSLHFRGDLPVQVIAESLIGAGALNNKLGRHSATRAYAVELLRLSEEQHFQYGEYWASFQIGRAAQDTGELDLAQIWLSRAFDASHEIRNPENHASMALGCLADVATDLGDDPEALRLAEEAFRLAQSCGNPHCISWLGLVAGRLRHKTGDEKRAIQCLIASSEAYAADHEPGGVRAALTELGRVALALDQVNIATLLLVAAHGLPAHEHDRPVHDAAMSELARRLNTIPGDLVGDGEAEHSLDELLDLARLLETAPSPPPEGLPCGLTPREMEVLCLLAEGHSNRAMADQLSLSDRTVENHVFHILTKLNLDSRTAAVAFAFQHGLVGVPRTLSKTTHAVFKGE